MFTQRPPLWPHREGGAVLHPATLHEMRALAIGDAMLVATNGRYAPRLRTALARGARAHRDNGHDFDWILTQALGWIVLERIPHNMPYCTRAERVAHWRGLHDRREARAQVMRAA